MPDFRVFCPSPHPSQEFLELSASESHHLVTVNRARTGDPVVAFDGTGQEWRTELERADRRAARLKIVAPLPVRPLPCAITLAQAVPKGAVMDAIVRHATEIGVRRIVPLHTERTQVQWDEKRQGRKREKWETAALEAAKQCGNPWLPRIDEPMDFAAAVNDLVSTHDHSLVASLHPGAEDLFSTVSAWRTATPSAPRRVLWWVGPEGDFTPAEMANLTAAGAQPVSLGPLVLRCDTAATYALAVISAALNP